MKCPGQDMQYWKPGAIFEVKCPSCGREVEFFKDDTTRKCGHCGHRFVNPKMDFGCAAYCPYAEQCLGTLPEEILAQKEDLLKDRVAIETKRYLKQDFKRIGRASRVARYAEHIGMGERGNMAVILAAAYLYEIGAHAAETRHGDTSAEHLAAEGPAVAESILQRLSAKPELIEAVRDIVGRHDRPGPDASPERRAVFDAHGIADLEDRHKTEPLDPETLEQAIQSTLLTETGRGEARKVLAF